MNVAELPARLPCSNCGPEKERVEFEASGAGGVSLSCSNCYDADCVGDPAHFVSSSIVAWGATKAAAIEDWNDRVEDAKPETEENRR